MNTVLEPLFSLVIATLHDDGELLGCLESLEQQQDAPAFEVIVVDQNGDNRLDDLIATYAKIFPVTHLRVGARCASRARNLGARHARGAWLGFPDDDCILLPGTLRHAARFASDTQLHVLSGQTVDAEGRANILHWRGNDGTITRWTMFNCITEATTFVKRATFLAIGGFDERFGPGSRYPAAEGMDLINRALADLRPEQARYTPTVQMQHPTKTPPWTRWAVGRFYSYGLGAGALSAKHRQLHMLYFWLRSLAAAAARIPSLNGWRSLCYLARFAGLVVGFVTFRRSEQSCSG